MSFAALLNISDDKIPWLKRSKVLGAVIKPQLDALVIVNQLFLRLHHATPLYRSKVVYREEPPTIVTMSDGRTVTVEEFAAAPIVFARGWGDCDDLSPLRCAELRNSGERATIRIQWKTQATGQKLYHILVRRMPGPRWIMSTYYGKQMRLPPDFDPRFMVPAPDGSVIEDPNVALGMPASLSTMRKDVYLTS